MENSSTVHITLQLGTQWKIHSANVLVTGKHFGMKNIHDRYIIVGSSLSLLWTKGYQRRAYDIGGAGNPKRWTTTDVFTAQ